MAKLLTFQFKMERENIQHYERDMIPYTLEASDEKSRCFYRVGEDVIRNENTGDILGLSDQFLFLKEIKERGLDSFSVGKIGKIKKLFEDFNIDYIKDFDNKRISIEEARGQTLGKAVNFLCHNETI